MKEIVSIQIDFIYYLLRTRFNKNLALNRVGDDDDIDEKIHGLSSP